jgi:SAM-dependent methyltransferase
MSSVDRDPARAFWESPEMVETFAAREPDHRLVRLLPLYPDPSRVRVLDLGCAAGRNTALLAERGFDVHALDASRAMIAAARRRALPFLGEAEAERRIRVGRMDRLDGVADGSIDLLIALGIYHGAASRDEWDRALAESARVMARGALALVANHTTGFAPPGVVLRPVPGEPGLVDGLPSGRSMLLDAPDLDREMGRYGLVPHVPTETVTREEEGRGRRVTANALYRRV